MSQVDPWLAILRYLMEHVIAKKLQHVSVTGFTPLQIATHA